MQVFSQSIEDLNFFKNHLVDDNFKTKKEFRSDLKINYSGYLPFLFSFYKNYLSSQDFSSCVYHPSCSAYAVDAISKKGLFHGGLMTFDRLTRCNPSAVKSFDLDFRLKRLKDEVE